MDDVMGVLLTAAAPPPIFCIGGGRLYTRHDNPITCYDTSPRLTVCRPELSPGWGQCVGGVQGGIEGGLYSGAVCAYVPPCT